MARLLKMACKKCGTWFLGLRGDRCPDCGGEAQRVK